jgi:DEAD/DEAH box helicase domain-containing protein
MLEGRKIYVFDIETIGNIRSTNFVETMEITVVGLYSFKDGQYHAYFRDELPVLAEELKDAEMLVGYNNDHFDTPILNKYMPFDLASIASLDIMKELQQEIGHRVGLNAVAGATLGDYKSASGKEAMVMWEEGRLDELKQYCLDDVKLTKEVFDFAFTTKKLNYTSKDGWLRIQVPMEWDINKMIEERSNKSQYSLW